MTYGGAMDARSIEEAWKSDRVCFRTWGFSTFKCQVTPLDKFLQWNDII